MKKYIPITLLLLFTSKIFGQEQVRQDDRNIVEGLINEISLINQKIDSQMNELAQKNVSCVVIVLGTSRMGKSTLINFLAGKQLVSVDSLGNRHFNVPDAVPGIDVDHTGESVTKYPGYWYDEASRTVYYDCPGFDDSSVQNELTNTFTFQKLISTTSMRYQVKIILASSLDSCTVAREVASFRRGIEPLVKLFSNHIGELRTSLCLLFTAVRVQITQAQIKDKIIAIVIPAMRKDNNNNPSISFLENLPNTAIAYMPYPKEHGHILCVNTEEGLSVKNQIVHVLGALGNLSNIQPTLNPSPTTQALANSISVSLNDKVRVWIQKKLFEILVAYSKKNIQEGRDAQETRSKFNELKRLFESTNPERASFLNTIRSLSILLSQEGFRSSFIDTSLSSLDFLAKLTSVQNQQNDPLVRNFESWVALLEPSKTMVTILCEEPKISYFLDTGLLQLKGVFSDIKDLKNKLDEKTNENKVVKRVCLFIMDTFYFNDDFLAPGVSVCIIAPCWKVIGQPTFSLKGGNGSDAEVIPLAQDGRHGNPGNPGMPGGNFLGMVLQGRFRNGDNISFNVSGGNGGRGGNGNQGIQGRQGDDAILGNAVATIATSYIIDPSEKHHYSTRGTTRNHGKQGAVRYRPVSFALNGNQGLSGGTGGQGGAGGVGGTPGEFKLIELQSLSDLPPAYPNNILGHMNAINNSGQNGSNGNHGIGGIGGAGGRNATGTARAYKEGEEKKRWVDLGKGIYYRDIRHDDANRGPQGDNGNLPNPLIGASLPQLQPAPNFNYLDFFNAFKNWFEEEKVNKKIEDILK